MGILSSMNLTSALSNGFQGLFNSGQRHHQASQDILQNTIEDIAKNYTPSGVQDRVSISSTTENISDSPSLEEGILNMNAAGVTYNASAKLVTATNNMFDAMFRAIA